MNPKKVELRQGKRTNYKPYTLITLMEAQDDISIKQNQSYAKELLETKSLFEIPF